MDRTEELVAGGRTVVDVAQSLGIAASCLYRWKAEDLTARGLKDPSRAVESKALAAARRRIEELEQEVTILRRAAAAVEEVVPPKRRFELVAELADDGIQVRRACLLLGVSRSGFYEWRGRAPSARAIRHAWLSDLIAAVHADAHGAYGRPRVHAELVLGLDYRCGRKRVARLMRANGLVGVGGKRKKRRRPDLAVHDDLVQRRFVADAPDRLWCTDVTEHPTAEGKVYCCAVLDVYSRTVVGWAIDSRQHADLATNALGMAIENRARRQDTIIHADHGTQFTSWAFTERARVAGLLPSLGSIGDPYDNAVIESFLGPHANRAPEPTPLEHPPRARERDLRVHRRVPQPPTPTLSPELDEPHRVREPPPPDGADSSLMR